jgi:hypothetical protein
VLTVSFVADLILNASSAGWMRSSLLLDQFVGNCAQPRQYGEAERLRSPEVNDKPEFGLMGTSDHNRRAVQPSH